jgi:hypothetical protein
MRAHDHVGVAVHAHACGRQVGAHVCASAMCCVCCMAGVEDGGTLYSWKKGVGLFLNSSNAVM